MKRQIEKIMTMAVAAGLMTSMLCGEVSLSLIHIFQNYTVPQALLFSMTIFLLMGICYGMVEFLLNGLQKGKLGTVVLSVWSVAWIFLKTNTTDFIRSFMKYAPQGWYNLGRNNISASKSIISGLFVGVVVLFIVNFVLVMQKKLELVK